MLFHFEVYEPISTYISKQTCNRNLHLEFSGIQWNLPMLIHSLYPNTILQWLYFTLFEKQNCNELWTYGIKMIVHNIGFLDSYLRHRYVNVLTCHCKLRAFVYLLKCLTSCYYCYSKESFEIGLHISNHENVMLFYFPNYELPAVVPTALNKGISIMR